MSRSTARRRGGARSRAAVPGAVLAAVAAGALPAGALPAGALPAGALPTAARAATVADTSAADTAATDTAAPNVTSAARLPARFGPPVVGVVRDSAGAPLANVQVVIAALNRASTTDEQGRFAFRGLAPGRYHLDAIRLGYRRADFDVVVPAAGADVEVAITMRPTALRLSGVVVTASPTGADPLRITQSTVELAGKDLQRNLGASVAQTLNNEPGMAMRFNGPAANVPVIRGLSGERILVLQDGQRAGDLSSTSADHGLSVDPLAANRIEVVRGPASLLYGTQALGGVVNVISNDVPTDVPTHRDGYVATQTESVTPGAAGAAGVTLAAGPKVAVTARAGLRNAQDLHQGGGDRLANSFNRNQNALLGVGYVGDGLRAGVAASAYGFRYGLPAADDERAHIEGHRRELRGRVERTTAAGPLTNVRAEGTAQWYTHDEVEEDGAVGTTFDLQTQTANVTARTRLGRLDGAVGVQGLFRQYAARGEEALTPAANTTNGGLFVYQELPLTGAVAAEEHGPDDHASGVRLQFGGRFDAFRVASRTGEAKFGPGVRRTFNNASGSVGVSVPLADRVTFGVSAARAFRAPTVEELFSNAFHAATGTYDVGSPSLKAETNQGVDGVLRAQRGRVDAQLSGYYNRINDYITPVVSGRVDPETGAPSTAAGAVPLNLFAQRDARLYGAEGRVEVEPARRLVLGATGDLVRGEFTAGGGALPYLPPARLGALARWDDGRFSLSGEVRHAFAQDRTSQPYCGDPLYNPAPGAPPCLDVRAPAYTLANLSAGVTLVRGALLHSITLRADNLLDESYIDATSRIKTFARNPGRNVALVYRVQF